MKNSHLANIKPAYQNQATEQLNEFEEKVASELMNNGFAVIEKFFEARIIDKAVQECNEHYSNNSIYKNENRRVINAWKFSKAVREIACDKTIVTLLSKVYGRNAYPFQTLNFDIGTEQPLHADTVHFNSIPAGFMAGVWVAFEDVDLKNGPLQYVRGSQSIPALDLHSIGINPPGAAEHTYSNYYKYENFIKSLVKQLNLTTSKAILKKGDLFIWSSNLIHGGSEIEQEGATRLSQVTHYFFDNCINYTPLLSDTKNGLFHLRSPTNIISTKKTSLNKILATMNALGIGPVTTLRSLIYTYNPKHKFFKFFKKMSH